MEGMITREGARRTTKDDPDDEVLVLLGQGDLQAALRLLMERYGADVYRFCRRMLRDKSLADDVLQQVFFDAYRDLPRFEGRSSMRTWLFGIARHRVFDIDRTCRRREAHTSDAESAQSTDAPDPRPSPAESLDEMRLRQVLADSLEGLSEPVRVTVLLRFQQGLTYEEIASIGGESISAAHARVLRGLQQLRRSIEGRIGDLEQLRR